MYHVPHVTIFLSCMILVGYVVLQLGRKKVSIIFERCFYVSTIMRGWIVFLIIHMCILSYQVYMYIYCLNVGFHCAFYYTLCILPCIMYI